MNVTPSSPFDSQTRLVSFATERSYSGVAHQSPELRCAFAKGPIAKRCLDHPRLAYILLDEVCYDHSTLF